MRQQSHFINLSVASAWYFVKVVANFHIVRFVIVLPGEIHQSKCFLYEPTRISGTILNEYVHLYEC